MDQDDRTPPSSAGSSAADGALSAAAPSPAETGGQPVFRPAPHAGEPPLRSGKRFAALLFAATCVSTFVVGMKPGGGTIFFLFTPEFHQAGSAKYFTLLQNGALYSLGLIAILLTHEMGHYLQARRYGVPATLPYFIPMPILPFGTMGAVIFQGAGVANRKQLFDIAISGPLAGLVVALPIAYFGVLYSKVEPISPTAAGLSYGEPLILQWMIDYVHPVRPEGQDVMLNPLLFAAWVGIFVTALNLIPVGQLDGGHILYTLIGRPAHKVAILILVGAIAGMVYFRYPAYGLMVVLLVLMGPRHPPTADDSVPLGRGRVLLGWLTLAFIVVGFTPRPIRDLDDERPEMRASVVESRGSRVEGRGLRVEG